MIIDLQIFQIKTALKNFSNKNKQYKNIEYQLYLSRALGFWSIILTHYLVLQYAIRDMANVLTLLFHSSPSPVSSVMFNTNNHHFPDILCHIRFNFEGTYLSSLRHIYHHVCR